ncbi:MAG: AAA family ATPase [Trueperaceae bacterium]|nr:MAG: AAA family ATPase [Trueperaceae bacterium]
MQPPFDKGTAILYYLAFQGDWVLRRDILFLLWPDIEQDRAQRNLRQHLLRLRKLDWAKDFEVERTRLRWAPPTDVRRFNVAIDRARWQEAATQVSGSLLAGLSLDDAPEFETWLAAERQGLYERFRQAVFTIAAESWSRETHLKTIGLFDRLLEQDPFDEEVFRRRLQIQARAGEREGIKRAFASYQKRLSEELGGEPDSETLGLVERLLAADTASEPLLAGDEPRSLPRPGTSFVGRRRELERLGELLGSPGCQLLTITGPGGIGKTRLALALGEDAAITFRDGAVFVPFADVETETRIVATVAAALGIELRGQGSLRQQLLTTLTKRNLLLILDNLEHLPAAAEFVLDLLQAAPDITVLATTRSRLDLQGEYVCVVSGLDVTKEEASLERTSEAARLFLQRAQQLVPCLEPPLPAVEQLVRLVGGMPLAIELAAGWVDTLPVESILEELVAGLNILEGAALDLPLRQRSVQAVFDVSWDHLEDRERDALRRLSVFRGGFELEGARVVAETHPAALKKLVRASWLQRNGARYTFHPLVGQFLREMLVVEAIDTTPWEKRHASFMAHLLKSWGWAMKRRGQQEVLAAVERDLDNLRVFWRRVGERGWYQEAATGAEATQIFFDYSGRWEERTDTFRTFIDQAEARADNGSLAQLAMTRARMHASFELDELRHCLHTLADIGDDTDLARAHTKLTLPRVGAPFAEACQHFQQALRLYQQLGDPEGEVDARRCYWELLTHHGYHEQALASVTEETRLAHDAGLLHVVYADIRRLRSLLLLGWVGEANRIRPIVRRRLGTVSFQPIRPFLYSEWFECLMLLSALENRTARTLRHLRCYLEAVKQIGYSQATIEYIRAMVYNDLGLYHQAGHHARALLSLEGEYSMASAGLLQLARAALGEGRLARVRTLLQQALAHGLERSSPELLLTLAELVRSEGLLMDAVSLAMAVKERSNLFILHQRWADRLLVALDRDLPKGAFKRAVERCRTRSSAELSIEIEQLLA